MLNRCHLGCLAAVLVLSACTPKYPKCEKDEDCRNGEHCINGACQQCRDTADCPAGQVCEKGRCQAECQSDEKCGPGKKCIQGRCLARGCQTDADCPAGQGCQNGTCAAPPRTEGTSRAPCEPEPIYFDFGESVLTLEATKVLKDQIAPCVQKALVRKLRIEGHCDPRGTEEYNLALGERRAQTVKRYLGRLGVLSARLRTLSKGKLEATGTNETGWSKDRHANFAWE
jgi:peptidoglycan-associated lipoprotein